MPATKQREQKVELSHFRARVRLRPEFDTFYASRAERLTRGGRWVSIYTSGLIRADSKEELEEALEGWNETAQRRLNAKQMQKARRERKRYLRTQRRKEAREEYSQWLDTLPIDAADLYKEDPDHFRYTGGPNGGREKRSMTDFLDLKALEYWPEQTREMKDEIRQRHGLRDNARLI